jgi:glycosyltransferase involved in cell wall biosynthesis
MRVALDGRLILAHMTGIGRYLLGLAGALARLPGEDRFELWLQPGLPAAHPVWDLPGERLSLRLLPGGPLEVRQQWIVPAALRRNRPDLLHYPHFNLPLAASGPVVATIHDLKYIARPDFFPRRRRARRLVMLAWLRFTVRRAARVIVPSGSTRRDLLRILRADPHTVAVVPEGVDPIFFEPVPPAALEALRRRYGLQRPFLLFVGERRPHKNLPGLLRAFDRFRRFAPGPYELLIAGRPYPGYREPERLAEELELGGRVRFLDGFPEADLPALYQAAGAVALLSFYEGFGLPALEALASGTPVVAADCAALPEVIGEAGVLVPPDDPEAAAQALLRVVSGGELGEACARNGPARAGQFTWERCAQETRRIYREAFQPASGPAEGQESR